ncbi:MAG: DVUA0089 family protein [Bryobacteraceae bacterium]|nr:DVUA0089 family protein [Bryobacteraceae bacterium]
MPFKLVFAVALGLLAGQTSRSAIIWEETGSAGRLPDQAQYTLGAGPLSGISGNLLDLNEIDLYRILITDPQNFSAMTSGESDFIPDPQLFLFDLAGFGVYSNDDGPGIGSQSELPAGHTFSPLTAGLYLLGIGRFPNEPSSNLGLIFRQNDQVGSPDLGAGGSLPLAGWTDDVDGRPDLNTEYFISLTGASVSGIPEPGSFLLTASALAVTALAFTKLRSR